MVKILDYLCRWLVLWSLKLTFIMRTKWFKQLHKRVIVCEVGVFGHWSEMDGGRAQEQGLRPLNPFEKWLTKPLIEQERTWRRRAFRDACMEVTGEDLEAEGI